MTTQPITHPTFINLFDFCCCSYANYRRQPAPIARYPGEYTAYATSKHSNVETPGKLFCFASFYCDMTVLQLSYDFLVNLKKFQHLHLRCATPFFDTRTHRQINALCLLVHSSTILSHALKMRVMEDGPADWFGGKCRYLPLPVTAAMTSCRADQWCRLAASYNSAERVHRVATGLNGGHNRHIVV